MKKKLLVLLILTTMLILTACNSSGTDIKKAETKEKTIFTESDIEKAEEMLVFLDDKMQEFQSKTNSAVKNGDVQTDKEETFDNQVRLLADEIVVQPFVEKYEDSIVPEQVKGKEQILVYFNKTNSEPCSLNFCEYDGIEVMDVAYKFNENEEYKSDNFYHSELIFNNILYDYKNDDEEAEDSVIRFAKGENGQLILTQHPYLGITNLKLKEYDKEFESIATDVPESEVEAEQAEYKKEVEETLAKFPKLQ